MRLRLRRGPVFQRRLHPRLLPLRPVQPEVLRQGQAVRRALPALPGQGRPEAGGQDGVIHGTEFPGGFQMATVTAGPLSGEQVCIDAEITSLGWCVCEMPCFTDARGESQRGPYVAVRREHLRYWSRVDAVYGTPKQELP
jgi:hypothetical protein